MTILLVTGVAYKQDKEVYRKRIEEFYGEKTILFDPEPYMEKSWLQKLLGWNKFLNMASDVINYWGKLPGNTRSQINSHYVQCLRKYKPHLIIAHSLGSVIAASSPFTTNSRVFCLGSPLWMTWVWGRHTYKFARLFFEVCLYSTRDWIAFRGLWPDMNHHFTWIPLRFQADTKKGHDLHHYLDYLFLEDAWRSHTTNPVQNAGHETT